MSQPTVYVLTRGSYSDRENVAVFSTREAAEAAQRELDSIDLSDIEEFVLDFKVGAIIRSAWYAMITLKTGDIYMTGKEYGGRLGPPGACEDERTIHGGRNAIVHSFVSQEHAIKLAIEVRQKWLRDDESSPTSQQ